jgi:hypothetical protein
VANIDSLEIGLLPPLGNWWCFHPRSRQRSHLHVQPDDKCTEVDRISDRGGRWSRSGFASGTILLFLFLEACADPLQSLIAVQNAVLPTQVPVAMALMIFTQNFGAAIAIVISSTIFTQTLTKLVPRYAPSVSAQAALEAGSGAGAVRHLVKGHEEELIGVLNAYSEGFRNIFYFLVGISVLAVGASLGIGWVDVRKKEEKKSVVGDVAPDHEKKSEEIGPIEV